MHLHLHMLHTMKVAKGVAGRVLPAILLLPLAVCAEALKSGMAFRCDADYVAEGGLAEVRRTALPHSTRLGQSY